MSGSTRANDNGLASFLERIYHHDSNQRGVPGKDIARGMVDARLKQGSPLLVIGSGGYYVGEFRALTNTDLLLGLQSTMVVKMGPQYGWRHCPDGEEIPLKEIVGVYRFRLPL